MFDSSSFHDRKAVQLGNSFVTSYCECRYSHSYSNGSVVMCNYISMYFTYFLLMFFFKVLSKECRMIVGCVAYAANKSSLFCGIFPFVVFAEVMLQAIFSRICFPTSFNWKFIAIDFLKQSKYFLMMITCPFYFCMQFIIFNTDQQRRFRLCMYSEST